MNNDYSKKDIAFDRAQADRIEVSTDFIKEVVRDVVKDVVFESHQAIANVQSNTLSEVKKLNGQGKVAKFLKTDLGLIITFTLFLSGIFSSYYSLKNDISLNAKDTNDILKTIDRIELFMTSSEKDQAQLNNRVSVLESFLKNLGLKL